MKPEIISQLHNAFNRFDKNLRYTVDMFQNEVTQFLDLKLSPDGITHF